MIPLDWLRGAFARLSAPERERLAAWRGVQEADPAKAHGEERFVVVDVESSGLDVFHDRLIAIGAVAVGGERIRVADHYYAVLRQAVASDEANILVHGIGGTAQVQGEDPRQALLAFLEFAGKSPLVAFHAPFDEIMLRRAMRRYLGEPFRRAWLDLAWLAPALDPERAKSLRSLDEWVRACGIDNARRHHALADALATAQLLLVLQSKAQSRGVRTTGELLDAARGQEWATPRRPR